MAEALLKSYALKVQERINAFLQARLDALSSDVPYLKEAMAYALLLGGKRSRPLLVYATGEALGVSGKALDHLAAAVECIHAYSLVHDDMPEMDNDELRRGHPTVHKKFGADLGLLTGDALQTLAFDILSTPDIGLDPQAQIKCLNYLAASSGFEGMCGGQAMDLHYEGSDLDLETLRLLHRKKTGALIKAAVMLPAIAAGTLPSVQYDALERYAAYTGLAFQVWDDVLDVTGSTEKLGKTAGADQALGKCTYPSIMGLKESQEYAQTVCRQAEDALAALPFDCTVLHEFARFTVSRDH